MPLTKEEESEMEKYRDNDGFINLKSILNPKDIARIFDIVDRKNHIEELKNNLATQVAGSVRWEECVRAMAASGADTMVEFGPGNVLTRLCSRTIPEVKTVNINSWDSIVNFAN